MPKRIAASDEPSDAMSEAYAALGTANYDALPELIARLDAALEQNPDRGRLAFYAGVMRLWRATGRPLTLGEQFNDVTQCIKLLERARELRSNDPHVNAFLGAAQTALGNATKDEARLAKGRQVLEDAIPLYPPYVNGVVMQALGALPREHPLFADATKAVLAVYEGCGATEAEIAARSFEYPAEHTLGTCWNGGIVSHVWEGANLIAGDVFVKQGDAESAKRFYNNAKRSATYNRSPFHEVLDRRLAEVDDRTALYLDSDSANDPPTWMDEHNLCVGCHYDKP